MKLRPYLTGLNLLMTIIFTYVLSAATLLTGHPLSALIFPSSFILASFAISAWRRDIKPCISTALTSLLIIIISLIAATTLEDHSYDGNCYHQEIIARLMYGWNPYHEYHKSMTDGFSIATISTWAMHYAKAIEISCASVGMLTGAVESGKAINLIFIASSFLLTYGVLGEILQAPQHRLRLAIATISTGNPVCMTQAPTFYIDYVKYYLLVFIIIQSYKIITTDKLREYLLLGGIILVGIGSKFNIFFETGLALMAAIAWCIYKRRWRVSLKVTATGIISFVTGAFIIGYHPYVTNWITAGHPLYPLLGEGAVDIMATNTPDIFSHGRVMNFFISLMSLQFPSHSQRIGGFGPLMAILVILSCISAVFYYKKLKTETYIATISVISCFIFSTSWWARYTSQLWMLPTIILIGLAAKVPEKTSKYIQMTLIACGLASVLISVGQAARFSRGATMVRYKLYEAIKTEPNRPVKVLRPSLQMANHFDRMGIEWQELPADQPLDSTNTVLWHYDDENFPLIQLTANQKSYLDSAAGRFTRHDSWSLGKSVF